jgi:GDP-L-fucose synthase
MDDLADACVFLLQDYTGEQRASVVSTEEITIAQFVALVGEVVGYRGRIRADRAAWRRPVRQRPPF